MSDRKMFSAKVKSFDTKQGIVTAVVSVTGNVDAQRDVVVAGAFDKSIMKWKGRMARGEFMPVLYGHKEGEILGKVIDLRATDEGLEVDERFFLENPRAREVFGYIQEGVLGKSSFAYDITKAKANKHGGMDLIELDLIEVGPTTYPANDQTRLVGVKDKGAAQASHDAVVASANSENVVASNTLSSTVSDVTYTVMSDGAKAGRVLSAASEKRVREHVTALKERLGELESWLDELAGGGDKTEEPIEAKVDDPPVKAEARMQMEAAFAVATG